MAIYKSKTPTKDGRQYFFRIKYKDIFGEIHDYSSTKYKLKKDAELGEIQFKLKIGNESMAESSITIKNAYLELIDTKSKKYKKQTLLRNHHLFYHLKPIEKYRINDLTLSIYKNLVLSIERKGFTPDYNNKILGLLKQIIVFSNKYYNTSTELLKFIEPYRNINKLKKEMLFFTYDEYKQFDSVISEFDYHVFFELLYFLGLRQGELQALTWKDVNFKNNTISITKTLTTKIAGEKYTISTPKTKNSIRILPLPKNVSNDLKSLYMSSSKYLDFSDNWFVFGNKFPFPETTIQHKKNQYCAIAGVKQIRVHDFRHSCASLLINNGASIALVSRYLGHSNISVTLNTYTHMYKSELENITNLIDNL